MNKSQVGYFLISRYLIEFEPEIVTRVMGACVVIACEYSAIKDSYQYKAISNKFDEVKDGDFIPLYQWIVHKDGDIEAVVEQ